MLSQFYRSLARTRRFSSVVPVLISEKKVKEKKAPKNWEESGLSRLEKELKDEGARYSRIQQRRSSHAQLMRYAMKEDVAGILSLAEANVRSKIDVRWLQEERDTGTDLDMLVSLSLLVTSRIINKEITNNSKGESAAAAFANIMDTLWKIKPGEEVKEGVILLWDTLNRLNNSRIDVLLENIRRNMMRMMKRIDISESRLMLNDEEKERIRIRMNEWRIANGERGMNNHHYDKRLSLVDSLRVPTPIEEYLGNPFAVEGLGEKELLDRFKQQMVRDSRPWLEVPNVFMNTRPIGLCSGEELISRWEWDKEIEKILNIRLMKTGQLHIQSLLANINISHAATCLYKAVVSTLGQGQSLLSLSSFQQSLSLPLLELSHNTFVSQHQMIDESILSEVFMEYSKYFIDESISRTRTHREWWNECTKMKGLSPSFDVPLRRFDYDSISQFGAFFMEVIFESCKFPHGQKGTKRSAFSTKNVSIEEESLINDDGRVSTTKMLSIDKNLLSLLQRHQFNNIIFPSWQLPMIIPPRPWIDRGQGGPLYTGSSAQSIRNLPEFPRIDMNYEMRKRLQDNSQGRPVFDALNCLGSTAWTINRPVLDVLKKMFNMSSDPEKKEALSSLSIPSRGDSISIPDWRISIGEGVEMDKAQWRQFYRLKADAIKEKNELNSLWYWMLYRLVLAEYFSSSILFFPHNMDFRGRVYPISPLLNHMGDDVNRSLLRFARGKMLGDRGLSWLKLHCINLTGKLKRQSIEERMKVADECIPLMIESAERPLDGGNWWKESDEPWQTLAACIELRDALSLPDPTLFISHLPVHQDGSCNGLQHYAALGRDRGGGSEVNLVAAPSPSDVYSSVAIRVEERRKVDEDKGVDVAIKLREKMNEQLPRKVIKQTVMTTVYGVTMYGAVLQIKRQLKALGMEGGEAAVFASYLAQHTFASLSDAFTSSMQLKDWLRQCARGVGELMSPVEWVTPLGLPVMQPYLKHSRRKGKLVLLPITSKQENAFPPNLVHSLDSTHMMLTALHIAKKGCTFAAVHDCFWTHASDVDTMGVICREQFVSLHEEDLIQMCSIQLKDKYLPLLNTKEDKDRFNDLFSPKVASGELNIKDVMDSIYFFS